ncbi:MAG: UDP-N-acetylmuramate--L-alanine ligase [Oscillospiraceae bacterium]|nr:UDP-N-acetylmuramate--L-alanine ligase [Oscillospiraceae bacterium]
MEVQDLKSFLAPGRRAHLVGIGGVSMLSLAQVLAGMGLTVTGSDMQESASVALLRRQGISVSVGHRAEQVGQAELVIRSAAIHDESPEIAAARAQGIPVFERAQAWGAIMQGYRSALCVAGTHGKTTTTGMCTHILVAAQRDPTVMIGGTLPLLNAAYRVGKGDTILLESCEYCNSFLSFFPTVAVILNIEADHLDFFKDLADIQRSFRLFARRVPEQGGLVVANAEDANTAQALENLDRPVLTFGLEGGDVHAGALTWERGRAEFDIVYQGAPFAQVKLGVPGVHNVKNALAAAAASIALGLPAAAVEQGLAGFAGVHRRFERKGTVNGAEVYDDYAHHPSELKALLDTAATLGSRRVICAFQPHTYSRTQALFDQFAAVLRQADAVLLAEIYAAREQNTSGISSADLAREIPGSRYFATLGELEAALRDMAQPGDLILTVGAGDIYTVGDRLVRPV